MFPAGINVGATWDKKLAYERGKAMGYESRDKGVTVQLGPVAGGLGRVSLFFMLEAFPVAHTQTPGTSRRT